MIAIIILILVLGAFYSAAKRKGKNGWLWAILAGIIFYGSQFLTGLLYSLYYGGRITRENFGQHQINAMVIALVTSVILTSALYLLLKYSSADKFKRAEPRYERNRAARARAKVGGTDDNNPYKAPE